MRSPAITGAEPVAAGDAEASEDEFALIARWFAPLAAAAPGAFGLLDDAALLEAPPGGVVVTTDTIVEGVHFLPDDPLDLVARKALRVNLSDLAAKRARPLGYLLALSWPKDRSRAGFAEIAAGLAADQTTFNVTLFGGDTTATPGPLTLTITAFGAPGEGGMLTRAGARAGDRVFVSGTIGDGGLGLEVARGGLEDRLSVGDRAALLDRFRLPQPRLGLRAALAHARGGADVSDGLLADLGHIASASGLGATVDIARLPLSPAARAWIAGETDARAAAARLASAGDDYEIVCAVPPEAAAAFAAEAEKAGIPVTDIGEFTDDRGVKLVGPDGAPIVSPRAGYRHF